MKLLLILLFMMPQPGGAGEDAYIYASINNRLTRFNTELQTLCSFIPTASPAGINDLQRNYNSLVIRCQTYCQAQQVYIGDSEELLSLMAQFQQQSALVGDSLSHQRSRMNATMDLEKVISRFTAAQDEYQDLLKQAKQLAASKSMESKLEELKASEKLLFAELSDQYNQLHNVELEIPKLKPRFEEMDELFVAISIASSQIQELKYKAPIERIRDTLIGIAAVAVVLMFLSMLQNKLQAAKQMRKSLNDLKKKYLNNNEDIPSI